MTILAATIACMLFVGLAVFQVALALGAPLGHLAWGGQNRVLPLPLRIGSAVSVLVFAGFGAIVLQRAGVADLLPASVADIGIWVVFAYLVLGVGMNALSRSRPERLVMTPLAAVLALLVLVTAMTSG